MSATPRWVRTLRTLDDRVQRSARASGALLDALVSAWTPPSQRDALTAWSYDQQPTYTQGGATFERGLAPWEKALLGHPRFARARRVLVGGAGGGREALALLRKGCSVAAFEPSGQLFARARATLEPAGGEVLRGSYEALVLAVQEQRGPLASLVARGPFDAVLLGWASLAHVCDAGVRRALFTALGALAPGAPIALSYPFRAVASEGAGATERLRAQVFHWSRRAGAPGTETPGLRYLPHAGFLCALPDDELDTLARCAGLAVALREPSPYPHALFALPHGNER